MIKLIFVTNIFDLYFGCLQNQVNFLKTLKLMFKMFLNKVFPYKYFNV